jgi:phosphate-selective porin OprO and OprP
VICAWNIRFNAHHGCPLGGSLQPGAGENQMKSSSKKSLLTAVAIGALLCLDATGARADSSTLAEIRALKAKLRELEAKVARDEEQVRAIAKFPKMPPVAEAPIVCKDAPCPPPPPPVFVSFANGLKVESWDGAFSFKIGGRIFVDGGVNSQPVENFAVFPAGSRFRAFFPAHGGSGSGDNVTFRQVRFEVEGKAWAEWLYKFQYDFRGSPNGLVQGGIRDAWLRLAATFCAAIYASHDSGWQSVRTLHHGGNGLVEI